jgi:hypothetical protein
VSKAFYFKTISKRAYSIETRSLASYDDTIFDEIDPIPCDPRLGDPVTSSEIQHAIQKMKTEKAAGKDGTG